MTRSRTFPVLPLALLGSGLLACAPADRPDDPGTGKGGAPGMMVPGTVGGAPPAAGGGAGDPPPPPPVTPGPAPTPVAVRTTPTNGSAVVITANDKYAVATNRTAGR